MIDDNAKKILQDILQNCLFEKGKIDAASYRADHEEWLDELSKLESSQYIKRENGKYRVSLVALTLLDSEASTEELQRCARVFERLRAHYKNSTTRATLRSVHDIGREILLSDSEIDRCMEFLMDASSLWFGGSGPMPEVPNETYFIPSESILRCKTFDDFISKVQVMFVPRIELDAPLDFWTETLEGPDVLQATLHPWPVVSSFAGELDPDDLLRIIRRSGLNIDLSLSKEQAYSAKTRLRAYLPRIDALASQLSKEDKIVAARNLARELLKHEGNIRQPLCDALGKIGWRINDGELTADGEMMREAFFPSGAEHTAYVEIRRILQSASQSLCIIDSYLDATIFTLLRALGNEQLHIQMLTSRPPADFKLESEKFKTQFPSLKLEVRTAKDFHDRFIVVDASTCYHVGASIKDAGKRACMISQLENEDIATSLVSFIATTWQAATPI